MIQIGIIAIFVLQIYLLIVRGNVVGMHLLTIFALNVIVNKYVNVVNKGIIMAL